ncbi:MAG TPA: hypothetical protein ENK44_16110 [Caldithrix abyssi]|uniref:Cell division protein ZapB n=1 Tax=Caldithrix abyssi TaxID=187145 RepID=A0A7V4U5G4_CALAY|nr:hypothetical protein [Caldithrix abyssi]
MTLDQLDKLKSLVESLTIKYRQLKYKNIKLEKENLELKRKLQTMSEYQDHPDAEKLEFLLTENERLKKKNKQAKNELTKLMADIEQNRL